jgi:hypothetical protein
LDWRFIAALVLGLLCYYYVIPDAYREMLQGRRAYKNLASLIALALGTATYLGLKALFPARPADPSNSLE